MIRRRIEEPILKALSGKKAVTIMGARQVGKSTLIESLFSGGENVLFLNGDEADIRALLKDATSTRLRAIFGKATTVVIDEAQKIEDIGNVLKLIADQMKEIRLVATGSSAFELATDINESLSGRKREFKLFPLSFKELVDDTNLLEQSRLIHHRLLYGTYPEVVTSPGEERIVLKELMDSYLYKDVLNIKGIAKQDKLESLLRALAFQIGSQVSYSEIANLIRIDSKTVEKYIDILEKCYIIFRLPSFARNLRNELKFDKKVYFWDMGIRNAIIGNFAPLELRNQQEVGQMWENWLMAERMKKLEYDRSFAGKYFWRTTTKKEIDLIEEEDGEITAYEFKWNPSDAASCPKAFLAAYPQAKYKTVSPSNVDEFLL
ncbi:MAG: ATP-binding protein [Bacteroidales bacterium]|nr:ATP-binding protein [Bacteroidales bacterium]